MNNKLEVLLKNLSSFGNYTLLEDVTPFPENIGGINRYAIMEGNGLIDTNGEIVAFQRANIWCVSSSTIQLCSYDKVNHKTIIEERLPVQRLFPGQHVFAITRGDSICGLAPVFDDKLDLAIYCRELKRFLSEHEGAIGLDFIIKDSITLAKFLWQTNRHKVKSILDELD